MLVVLRFMFSLGLSLGAVLAPGALADRLAPIPHALVVRGEADIAAAWLAEPTRRYGHGVLGDAIEAAALVAETADGERVALRLEDGSVFEDLTPRLADIDGDGRDEIWTVRSDASHGARFEAYGLVHGQLSRRFATSPIGTGYRWLNPVGVADFDGDGRKEAAYVQTPHIGGVLTIVRAQDARLVVVARASGYSNHAMGSTRLDLAAIADLDGDGAADIVLPDQRRTQLVVVSLRAGELVERWRSATGPTVDGALTLTRHAEGWVARHLTPEDATVSVRIPVAALRPLR